MKRIFTTTLRLDMTDEEDRQAWSHLQRMDKKQYRSYSKAIVAAVNDYFGRQEQLAADPYLETREKEDAFLQRIGSTICNALWFAPVPMAAVQPSAPMQSEPEPADDDLSMRWTSQTASDTSIAPDWYCCNTIWRHTWYQLHHRPTTQYQLCGHLVSPRYRMVALLIPERKTNMTEHEKKLIQARHRLEEAQMRDRDKERKARTRRLIQTGAILEKAFPQARTMTTDELEEYLCSTLKTE